MSIFIEAVEMIGFKLKGVWDSVLSYLVAGVLVFAGYVVDNGSAIMIFLGVTAGLLRIIHDILKIYKTWKQ